MGREVGHRIAIRACTIAQVCSAAAAWLLVSGNAAAAAGDPAAGAAKAAQCVECHVTTGDTPDPLVPWLDAMPAQYIVTQTLYYKTGKRESTVMKYVADTVTNIQDLLDIAAFYAARKPVAGGGDKTKQTELGREIYVSKNCQFCHGMDAMPGTEFISGAPPIAGQYAAYLEKTMLDFKTGRRPGDAYNLMKKSLLKLSDEEIAAVAAYISAL